MITLLIFLTWCGVGAAIGLGFVTVIIVAMKLSELFEKLCPKNKAKEGGIKIENN